jgi:putative DNA primase/helicase
MGIAKDHLTEYEREAIARGLFQVTDHDSDRGELHGLCPIHGEKNPSFSYNYKKDTFSCFSCQATGDLVDLFGQVNGIAAPGDRVRAFRAHAGIEIDPAAGAPPPPLPPAAGHDGKGPGAEACAAAENTNSDDLDAVFALFPPLPEPWARRLSAAGAWSAEALGRLDVRMQTYYRRKKDGALVKIRKAERLAIPIRDRTGAMKNIRLYKPGAKKMKIISWGKGFGRARLFPAEPLDAAGPVLLCEGEKDTITAVSHGFNGVTQTSKLKKWPKGHLEPFKDRDVVIAYDADTAGEKYAAFAAECLAPVARSVRMLTWPDYMGRQPDGTWPDKHGEDLTDFFSKHRKTARDLQGLIDKAEPYTPVKRSEKKANPAEVLRFFETGVSGRVSFKPSLLAEAVLEDVELMADPVSGLLYRWNGCHWEEYPEEYVAAAALNLLGDEALRSRILDAVYQARIRSAIPSGRTINDREKWVCLKNGMLNLRTMELKPHKKDFYATHTLNVVFDPDANNKCKRWLVYLSETIRTLEAIAQAQEFAGYCLQRSTAYEKCLLLVGPGSDGKSTFLKILRQLVGPENTTSVAFADLEDQFLRVSLHNKLLNISTEVGNKALESPNFKAIVTGDPINAAYKHQDSFSFLPYCKLAFATNKLPRVLDNSDGFFRRLLPISFKRQFPEDDPARDPHLEEKLIDELPGIFEWALVGLHRLWRQGRFTHCDETMAHLQGYRRLNNPVMAFVEDRCTIGDDRDAGKDDLYKDFKEYCTECGYSRLNKENFFRELYAAVNHLKQYRPRLAGGREYRIRGIGLNVIGHEES